MDFKDSEDKLSFLERLKSHDEPEMVEALVRGCFSQNWEIAQHCRNELKRLTSNQLQFFLKSLFNGRFGISSHKYFLLIDELHEANLMRYILRIIGEGKTDMKHYQQIGMWMQQSRITHRYLTTLLAFPPAVAKNAFTLLTQIDRKMPAYLLDLTHSSSPKMCEKIVNLVSQLHWNDEVPLQLLMRRFIQHPHPSVRAHTAYVVSGNLRNIRFLKRVFRDPAPEVRLSALKSIGRFSYKFSNMLSSKIIDLLYSLLVDVDVRVRVKAAQILYTYKDVKGLHQLISMLNSTDAIERAYAARLLGKLKEISVSDKLKVLAENDPDPTVRLEALNALKILDRQTDFLRQQFNQLEGIITRLLFSENEKADLALSQCLQQLDEDALKELIQSTGLAPDTAEQFMNIAGEIGTQGITVPLLLTTIIDEDGKVNNQKAADLQQITTAVEQTVQQLQSGIPDVVSDSFDKLTSIQRNTIKMMLVPALNQGNPRTMAMAAKILYKLNYTLAEDKLTAMVSDSDPQVRLEAADALSTIVDDFAAEHLKQLENDEDAEVQSMAQKGLDAIQQKLERNNVPEVQLKITDFDVTGFPTVRLYVGFYDASNHPLKDMELDDFLLLEGNAYPVKPILTSHKSEKPIAAAMVMDYSASMSELAISDVEAATARFIENLQPSDSAAILKFAEDIDVAQKLTKDKPHLARAIQSEYRLSTQGTALYDSIIQASDQLDEAEDSIKVIVVNTDGADTASHQESAHATHHAAQKKIAVYTIGLGD